MINARRITLLLLLGSLTTLAGCSYNYLAKPRPMVLHCPVERSEYMRTAANIFERNGYSVTEQDQQQGILMVQDSITAVAWRYESLVRTWKIQHRVDSVIVEVWSVSTRKDGSDVKQTWDKRWSDEIVKEWMRPVLTSLESACGLGSPLRPSGR